MKAGKYYLILAVVGTVLCMPILAKVDSPLLEDTRPMLIGKANLVLADIEPLSVVIALPESYPRGLAAVWTELRTRVERKLRKAGIEIFVPEPGITYKLPMSTDLKIDAEMLNLNDPQQDATASADSNKYVTRIQTSLSRAVRLSPRGKFSFKADVWEAKPVMQVLSANNIPEKVIDVALKQVDAFIACYLTTNSQRAHPGDATTTDIVSPTPSKGSTQQLARQTPAEYKYVASKNSKVFHRPDCSWAKRIATKNLVGYHSRQEAIDAGKRPCKLCKP